MAQYSGTAVSTHLNQTTNNADLGTGIQNIPFVSIFAWSATNLQYQHLNVDASGNLNVNAAAGGGGSVTQGTTPWVDNISQFGGSNVVTGTGTSGAGIPRVTVSSDSFPATQPVSGTVAVSNFPATQPVSGTVTANQGGPPWSVSQSGTWTTGRTWTLSSGTDSVNVGNFPATQPINAATLPLPLNAAQETGGNLASLVSLNTTLLQAVDLLKIIAAQQQQHTLILSSMSGTTVNLSDVMDDSGSLYQ